MKRIELGRLAGLRLTAYPSAVVTLLVIWLVLAVIAIGVLKLPAGEAIIGALVAAALHYASEMVHQLGHSIAARRTGYPMGGVAFWGPLGLSVYPKDEPPLPGRTHIRRALGGPLLSFALTIAAGLLYLFASGTFTLGSSEPHLSPTIEWVALFLFLDNLLVFSLGALLPLGFTDGSTILRWWGK
ncbi:MAG: hypothetical protein LCI00_22295 [Chloroflexi bacterium]|nr:hypothetical protein [Chloroflexota bacterium]MCC6895198.1 hypothetical protein [Anaerolineae bacterium]